MATYAFRLYVTGSTSRSERAINNLRALCDNYLAGDFSLEVVDVLDSPQDAENERILATPTVIRVTPEPRRRVIGDLSDPASVAEALQIPTTNATLGGDR